MNQPFLSQASSSDYCNSAGTSSFNTGTTTSASSSPLNSGNSTLTASASTKSSARTIVTANSGGVSSIQQQPSPTSILSNSNKSIYILFNKVWHLLVDMQNDPYPEVAEYSNKVVNFISFFLL